MAQMTVKEWAAEYKRINEAELEDRRQRLPQEPIADSVRSYFALCAFLLELSNEAEESSGLWERRLKDYNSLAGKWRRLARVKQHAAQS